MKMKEWTEYYNSPIRTKVLNVISLEFSKTRYVCSDPYVCSEQKKYFQGRGFSVKFNSCVNFFT